MTSFVTTATTMFSRFPLRHHKPKEPEIGFPILVESSRPDLLQMRDDSSYIPAGSFNSGTLKYTTTPNFNATPITPATNCPPTFHSIPRNPYMSPQGNLKKNAFTRKPVNSSFNSSLGSKSIDKLYATESTRTVSSESSGLDARPSWSNQVEPKSDIPPPPPAKAPRLRDSIVPNVGDLMDKYFLMSEDGRARAQQEEMEEHNAEPPTPFPSTTPIPLNSTSSRLPLPQVRKLSYEPEPLRVRGVASSSGSKSPSQKRKPRPPPILSPTGAPMIELAPLTPILQDNGDDASSILMSLVSDSGSSSPLEPKGGEAYIALLERQRDHLIAQQRSVMQQIKEVESCLPPNPSTHNYSHRKQLREDLRRLQEEYDSLSRDLYDKGLMLHRAWKRRDADMGLEAPAVLWVRRVGGP
ncbi:hypothetical protein DRE_00314 [Drechslerella stenobrocha 248]|uniref:Uncharacterized protein n=1 Tax=Drechslerella stenobrocha 248 TaxID=1043628 RepID=W7HTB2_9PEZI|nr:hypothetical protein DRE_00314 [Drechslerella stenobrocha 248]